MSSCSSWQVMAKGVQGTMVASAGVKGILQKS